MIGNNVGQGRPYVEAVFVWERSHVGAVLTANKHSQTHAQTFAAKAAPTLFTEYKSNR